MADCVDLIGGLDHALFRVNQDVQNGLDGFGMGGHVQLGFVLQVPAGDLVGQSAVDADAFAQALGGDVPGLGVHQLILQRGAAGVDD